MTIPNDLKYSRDHEWIKLEGNRAFIGITDFAQHQLGDIVFVELPAVGQEVSMGDSFAVIESVKAAADIYAPLSGTVVEVNGALEDSPESVNQNPYGSWIIVLELSEPEQVGKLLTPEQYESLAE